jgi:hypothetical protein
LQIFKEGIRFVEREPTLEPVKKKALIQEVRLSKSPTQVLRWIWTCLTFNRPDFSSLTFLEKDEAIKGLVQGLTLGPKQGGFLKILEIFFLDSKSAAKGIALDGFFNLVVERIRHKTLIRFKPRLVEILVRFTTGPPAIAQAADLIAGLYHPDKPTRCRCLLYIYKHFRSEGLREVIRVLKTEQPPYSLIFYQTLRSLIIRDQEIYRELKLGVLDLNCLWPLLGLNREKDEEGSFFEKRFKEWRLRMRLELIIDSENAMQKYSGQGSLQTFAPESARNVIRKERLQLIGLGPERRN